MIVEFLGMPGSGKTTLARTLLAELERFGKAPMTFETACRKLFYQRLPRPLAKILPFTIFHLGLSRIIFRIWNEISQNEEKWNEKSENEKNSEIIKWNNDIKNTWAGQNGVILRVFLLLMGRAKLMECWLSLVILPN